MAEIGRFQNNYKTLKIRTTNLDVYEKGNMVAVDTATSRAVVGGAGTTLVPVGYCRVTITGDGTNLVEVELFDEVLTKGWANDVTNPVVLNTHIMEACYISDTDEVSSLSTGRTIAGRVIAIEQLRVFVAMTHLNNL